jgi:23S rRNA pseudouridine2605 synthase
MHRVQKLLSNYGYCSRRNAEELIKEGRVKVNDKLITIGDQATFDDEIKVNDKVVPKGEKVYLMLNKPVGCVSALHDRHERTIMEFIDIKERVFPVGRLDKDTSGLLLLTNDGDFSNKVTHPSNEVKKTYVAKLDKVLSDKDLKKVEKGVDLEDGKTSPAKLELMQGSFVSIEIHEGKNRIVRRIFEAVGYKVLKLKRVKIGNLSLDKLEPGKYKLLQKSDLDKAII